MSPLVWGALAGGLVGLGLTLSVLGALPAPERLGDALRRLDGAPASAAARTETVGGSRVGRWAVTTLRLPLLPGQERQLALRGKDRLVFFEEKIIFALLGLISPTLVATVAVLMFGIGGWVPVGVGVIGCVAGFFVPDLLLVSGAQQARVDAGEALFTFFDLVTLERLANQSSAQALASAASLSDNPLFVRIRDAVERARLEQRPPWRDLAALGEELHMGELVDIADVMRLDETGAALSGVLRARVKELRDAHLTRLTIQAHAVTERMTIWMTLPAMIFGLLFLAPPILLLVGAK